MKEIAEDFFELNTDGKFTLFVNSMKLPDKEEPLDFFTYSKTANDEIAFSRLYRVTYNQPVGADGSSVSHKMLQWYPITVKPWAKQTLKQLCDSMAGARELLT